MYSRYDNFFVDIIEKDEGKGVCVGDYLSYLEAARVSLVEVIARSRSSARGSKGLSGAGVTNSGSLGEARPLLANTGVCRGDLCEREWMCLVMDGIPVGGCLCCDSYILLPLPFTK